jgi:hypothetical protein
VLHNGISPLNQQGMLFHRKAVEKLGGFDLQYRLCADLDFWARAYAAGFPFRYYNLETGQFRIRAGQLSGDVGQTRREQAAIVEKLFPQRPARLVLAAIRLLYRLQNLPRYVRRWRSVGWRRSEEVLGST